MRERDFLQVDVFADRPGAGNGLAVVLDADGLDAGTMQRFAHWTNLSETSFVLPPTAPGASYRVRIFTPRSELPFAGHPSVGTAHALLDSGRVVAVDGRLVQECAAGLLPIEVVGAGKAQVVSVRAPRARVLDVDADTTSIARGCVAGLPPGAIGPHLVDNGPRFWCIEIASEAAVRGMVPDLPAITTLMESTHSVGLAVFARDGSGGLVVRVFCPADGIPEDPVTGAANAAIAGLLEARGALGDLGRRYRVSQGREVGRDGRIDVHVDAQGDAWIGGTSRTVIRGTLAW
ncbi:MAG: PhzF family phenazine biosynthesis protein [Arenimonas sp.]